VAQTADILKGTEAEGFHEGRGAAAVAVASFIMLSSGSETKRMVHVRIFGFGLERAGSPERGVGSVSDTEHPPLADIEGGRNAGTGGIIGVRFLVGGGGGHP